MKKGLLILLPIVIFFVIIILYGDKNELEKNGKIRIVTTTSMITDLVRNIGGDKVYLQGLMGAGVDPHLYKASEGDVEKFYKADIVIFNGLHLEGKLQDVFEKMEGRGVKVYRLTDAMDKKKLISSSDFESHYDPHVWFDITLWKSAAEYVGKVLIENDSENTDFYKKRTKDYIAKIIEFENYSRQKVSLLNKEKRILITAHDAFNYFGQVYDFKVLGLQGLSTVSEVGVQDVKKLSNFIYDNKIKAIFVESSVSMRNIEVLKRAVQAKGFDVKIGGELFSDALGNPGTEEGTYLGMFKHNLDTIVDSLK